MEHYVDDVPEDEIPRAPPQRADPQLIRDQARLQFVDKFSSSEEQKTEITRNERQLLSGMAIMAKNMFPMSAKRAGKDPTECVFFKEFIPHYIRYGIPVGREGRKEELKAIQSIFNEQPVPDQTVSRNRLMG